MAKRQITKKQYERAKQIVAEYEAQFALSFVRGSFKASDLECISYSIEVKKLTENIFDGEWCHVLETKLNDMKVPNLNWCNTDDAGYLSIGFRTIDTNQYKDAVLDALNNL